ncbi:MAG TPA: hypothetical protein PK597_03895, partial [Oscillospiraceae bacterium]|nr:hypothetical protein [Oscillospiraceae bacterium]
KDDDEDTYQPGAMGDDLYIPEDDELREGGFDIEDENGEVIEDESDEEEFGGDDEFPDAE